MPRIGAVIREVYHRPGAAALPAHLEDHYGIRILWLSAWQCWLACVSAKVHQGFYPRREYITALAAAVRAHCGRPA